jgi:hypothetical protein
MKSDMTNDKRQAIEARIVRRVIKDSLAAGFLLSVHDGEDFAIRNSTDAAAVFNALRSTDEDHLHIIRTNDRGLPETLGTVFFVYGNDGHDVICDYDMSVANIIRGATELAVSLAE